MATGKAVWGIDIGQCALKALRCTLADDGRTLVADAFDFIEYPKILSQPEAEPEQLVRDALTQFLSRNSVRGDKVAISVSGQSGLARFIKLPPVEAKKIPDIVKYEAKQQIPFDLNDVIWDYQQLAGGSQEDGFALETEVGLFAMKRDQVFRAIRPFEQASIELDLVQLTPLCIYNMVAHELLGDRPPVSEYDPDDPPESLVVLSLGTDTTDLVVTNGYRMWQRNIPLGGNQFTKQLTKELKLTFAKAEHLKRNARQAEDPKTIFQAMRPVFNDLVTEVQRSIGFFQSLDRKAKVKRIVALGNAMKLPGLRQYLSKNLEFDVIDVETFNRMQGPAVVGAPTFKENLLSFAVCYGLCLQGLGVASLSTNLLPREILTDRLIRRKKPWGVAVVATLLLGCSFNFFFHNRAWQSVHEDLYRNAYSAAANASQTKSNFVATDTEQMATAERTKALGDEVVGNAEGRLLWPELLAAINAALPYDDPPQQIPTLQDLPIDMRHDLHIEYLESEFFPELSGWFNEEVQKKYNQRRSANPAGAAAGEATPPAETAPAPTPEPAANESATGPSGPGWVIELGGYHYFNRDIQNQGGEYVRKTILKSLDDARIELPSGPGKEPMIFTMKELGIGYAILAKESPLEVERIRNPEFTPPVETNDRGGARAEAPRPAPTNPNVPEFITVRRFNYVIQFCWQEHRATQRLEERRRLEQQQEQQQDAGANQVAGGI